MFSFTSIDPFFGSTGLGIVLGTTLSVIMAIALLLFAGEYIATALVFMKAGEKPWKALIPVYDRYTMFNLCWDTNWFIPWAVSLGVLLCSDLGLTLTSMTSGFSISAGFVFFYIVFVASAIAFVTFEIILVTKIAKAFDKDGGFAVGLVLLYSIFMMILAFGDSKYDGKYGYNPSNGDWVYNPDNYGEYVEIESDWGFNWSEEEDKVSEDVFEVDRDSEDTADLEVGSEESDK